MYSLAEDPEVPFRSNYKESGTPHVKNLIQINQVKPGTNILVPGKTLWNFEFWSLLFKTEQIVGDFIYVSITLAIWDWFWEKYKFYMKSLA